MAMNFYREQEQARRQIKILFVLFVIATLLLSFVITQAIRLGLFVFEWFVAGNEAEMIEINSGFLWFVSIALIFSVLIASFYKIKQLSSGDYSAIMMSGLLLNQPTNLKEQQIRNTVEEMAVSAGIPVPKIYVLENEPSVNAFAAGLRPADMAIGLTRGCLERLNRDEFQGLAAYQMAQIITGNARLNTLIYGVLFGLQFMYVWIARLFVTEDEYGEKKMTDFRIIIALLPLWLVAYMGHFLAKIIKSLICKENVFKMDAVAVQLTRNPNGIASVLQKSLQTKWSYILFADTFLLDLEHLLFSFGNNPIYEFKILHTHPDTRERIKKILPHWNGELPKTTADKIKELKEKQVQNDASTYSPALAAIALGSIEGLSEAALSQKKFTPLEELQDEAYWFAAARQPEKASAVVLAMLARHSDNKKACLDIAELFSQELHNNIKNLLEHALLDERRFAVLAVALPNLRLNVVGEENINKYKHFLQEVIKSDEKITLFEHCVYAAVSGSLKMSLMAGFLPPVGKDKLKPEIIELLNLTAQHSNSGHHAEKAFQAALTECGFAQTAYRDNIPLGRLSSLLHTLDRLSAADKQQILTALENIAHFDEVLSESEKDWLSAVAIAWEV